MDQGQEPSEDAAAVEKAAEVFGIGLPQQGEQAPQAGPAQKGFPKALLCSS